MDNRGHDRPQAQFRLDWVDVARGIGVVAVVIGHVWTRGPVRDAMYSFHMPLFFLLSGMLSRPHAIGDFTRRQLVKQMRPYAAFLLILLVADQIIERLKGGLPIFHQWPGDSIPILLGGSWLRGPYTIFWFVPCLLIARLLFNVALVRWPDVLNRRWGLILLPMIVLAYALGRWTEASPLGVLSVPMAFVLLWTGAIWPRIRWRGWMLLPLSALALGGLAGVFPTLNMKAADYGWPLLSIGSAVATSLLLFRLSALIAPFAGSVAAVGRASLVVMYLHVAVIHYLSPYLGKPWLLLLALLVPFCLYQAIRRSHVASRWLL
ncbi:acyltransferase family protein [Sphingobium sp. CR2-8]|uniref:acyltransferase family protein n=1 Tax=Sphingobium sp. CR2-8 TaxID=1306534 RepID=UPI002DB61A69|nr:acyltransferase family protein [Sphingobium sp. CR2-8]MEC3910810.1 acyltransferase family protein [Sphingobium sp. CR2-8]